jgi:hypothetical protein
MAAAAPAARPAPPARPTAPGREKKTADVTPPAPIAARPEPAAVARGDAPGDVEAAGSASAEALRARASEPEQHAPASVPDVASASLPADPLDTWRRGAETVGGLAADFAELASRAVWRDDVLEVVLPASAGNAASFLRRPEIAAGLTRALTEVAGRSVRHSLVIDSTPEPVAGDAESEGRRSNAAERGRPAPSQAAMLREAAEHPLVVHVRTLFDAAVRKVEPPRPRPTAAVSTPVGQTVDPSAGAAVAHDDDRDHAAVDDHESGEDYGGIDG